MFSKRQITAVVAALARKLPQRTKVWFELQQIQRL
jgi:hypothetical protein